MVNYKLLPMEIGAILVAYLLLVLPVTTATDVNIIFNGQTIETVELAPEARISHDVNVEYDPITGASVLVDVSGTTAEKIYIYKCGKSTIAQCMNDATKGIPDEFDSFVSQQEYSWDDLAEQDADTFYPQSANLLFVIRTRGLNDKSTWFGIWYHIERTDATTFNIFSGEGYEAQNLDLHIKSQDLIEATKSFVVNYQMIPFTWLTKAVFRNSGSLHELAATSSEIEIIPPAFSAANPSSNEITTMFKDYYIEFPVSSGQSIGNAITLNLNPSFQCGNGNCEADLGESSSNCCYDCACGDNEYCDISDIDVSNANYGNGQCRPENTVTISSASVGTVSMTDCSADQAITITAAISNAPSSLPNNAEGRIKIADRTFIIDCTKQVGNSFTCPLTLEPIDLNAPQCGTGNFDVGTGTNMINLTLKYNDGARSNGEGKKSMMVSKNLVDIDVDYSCECQDNYYCDVGQGIGTGTERCMAESNMQMSLIPNTLSSYLHYNTVGTNFIDLSLEILNPPGGFGSNALSVTLSLGTLNYDDTVLPPQPTEPGVEVPPYLSTTSSCNRDTSYTGRYVYDCSFQFSIDGYDPSKAYIFKTNDLTSSVTYADGAIQRNKQLVLSNFGDIYMPTQDCGNGYMDTGETADNCCVDVGCSSYGPTYFCDPQSEVQCTDQYQVGLSDIVLDDYTLSDTEITHEILITSQIVNMPSDIQLDSYTFSVDGNPMSSWDLVCDDPTPTGALRCTLIVPELDYTDLPIGLDYDPVAKQITFGRNSLNLSVIFHDQYDDDEIQRNLGDNFDDIVVDVIYHCGNGECETELLEDASNCCLDCACEDDPDFGSNYFCDYHEDYNPDGTCLSKDGMDLVIDSVSPLNFESCEVRNHVTVEAHIENEPYDAEMQGFWANLNGTGASSLRCRFEELEGTEPPEHRLNCTITVPSVDMCSKGDIRTYESNDINVRISHNNGDITQTSILSAVLPTFTTTQSIRTMHDIITDTVEKLMNQLDKTKDITEDLLDWMEICLWGMIVMAIVSVAVMVVVPIKAGGGIGPGKTDWDKFGDAMGNSASAGSSLMDMWSNICQAINQYFEVQMDLQEIQMEMIEMYSCIEIVQHTMDIGGCQGQESSCFSQMASCVDFGDIKSFMNDIETNVNQMGDYASDAFDDISDAAEDLTEATSTGEGTISVRCDGPNSRYCCGYEYDNGFKKTDTKIDIRGVRYCDDTRYFALWKDADNYFVDQAGTYETITLFDDAGYSGYNSISSDNTETFSIGFYCDDKDDFEPTDIENKDIYYYCEGDQNRGCVRDNCGSNWYDETVPTIIDVIANDILTPGTLTITGYVSDQDLITLPRFEEIQVKVDIKSDSTGNTVLSKTDTIRSCEYQNCQWEVKFFSSEIRNLIQNSPGQYDVYVSATDKFGNSAFHSPIQIQMGQPNTGTNGNGNDNDNGGSTEGTPVDSSNCNTPYITCECKIESECDTSTNTWEAGKCTQFKSNKYYEQTGGIWYEYDSSAGGRTSGSDIRCCVPINQPPEVAIISPVNEQIFYSSSITVTGTVSDSDDEMDDLTINVFIEDANGEILNSDGPLTISETWSFEMDMVDGFGDPLPNGAYIISATVWDDDFVSGSSNEVSINLDFTS